MSALTILKDEQYRFGDIQVLLYEQARVNLFPPPFASVLYGHSLNSGKHWLSKLFCGLIDGEGKNNLSHDFITTYLLQRPLLALVNWKSEINYDLIGYAFPTSFTPTRNIQSAERSAFAAYGMFRPWWGKPELEIAGMLGLAYMFEEWGLTAVQGISLAENNLTRRFMSRYGSVQTGYVPRYQLQGGKLVPGVVTTLMRESFEEYVTQQLLSLE